VVGSAAALPFPDESFDTVVCWEVLEHIPPDSEPTAFREIHRVLRPGGVLYLSTPYASGIARLLDPAWWLIGHRHYRKRALAEFAGAAGLEVELLEVRGGLWQIVGILNLYIAKWVFRREPFLEDAVNRRMDREFSRPSGYANAFLKCRRARRPR
jgi:SAM-dependent methyltransferase